MKTRESRNSLRKEILVMLGMVAVLMTATIGSAAPFNVGDVFLSTGPNFTLGGNEVRHFNSAGTYIETLVVPETTYTDAGMAFDAAGNLYVTLFFFQNVSKFNNTGVFQNYFGSGYGSDPESILFDAAGNAYVGQADGSHQILKFDASGNPITTFSPATQNRGTDWIDLAADQRTMYYTSEGDAVKRFDVVSNTQLDDFANASVQGTAGPCYALRIRPGTNEVMVACTSQVYRLNATSIIQTYPAPAGDTTLFALNLDPDGTSFWTADLFNGKAHKFGIANGTLLMTIDSGMIPGNNLGGIGVFGEITAGKPSFSFTATKDFRFTNVNFTATPANLGTLLPQNGSKYNVSYVIKPKDGTVSSTNPGQLYGVISLNGTGLANVTVNDTFNAASGATQFMVNPPHLDGGVEVLRVNTTTGNAVVITGTPQVTSATVNNAAGTVNLTINLTTPLASDEKLMIYIKFQTSLKGSLPNLNDFINTAVITANSAASQTTSATINFFVKPSLV